MAELCLSSISGTTLEKAKKELFEDPEKRLNAIAELRDKIARWTPKIDDKHEQDLVFANKDDKFLLCFLRAKKFDTERALQLYVNYYKYRNKYAHILGEMSVASAEGLLSGGVLCVLPSREDGPRIIVIRAGLLDFEHLVPGDVLKCLLLVFDKILESDEYSQVHGLAVIEDLTDFSLWSAMNIAGQEAVRKGVLVELMQESFPARFKGVHFVHQPWYFSLVFSVIKPFLKQKLRERFQLHGGDFESLHTLLSPSVLPVEYGGELSSVQEYAAIKLFQQD